MNNSVAMKLVASCAVVAAVSSTPAVGQESTAVRTPELNPKISLNYLTKVAKEEDKKAEIRPGFGINPVVAGKLYVGPVTGGAMIDFEYREFRTEETGWFKNTELKTRPVLSADLALPANFGISAYNDAEFWMYPDTGNENSNEFQNLFRVGPTYKIPGAGTEFNVSFAYLFENKNKDVTFTSDRLAIAAPNLRGTERFATVKAEPETLDQTLRNNYGAYVSVKQPIEATGTTLKAYYRFLEITSNNALDEGQAHRIQTELSQEIGPVTLEAMYRYQQVDYDNQLIAPGSNQLQTFHYHRVLPSLSVALSKNVSLGVDWDVYFYGSRQGSTTPAPQIEQEVAGKLTIGL